MDLYKRITLTLVFCSTLLAVLAQMPQNIDPDAAQGPEGYNNWLIALFVIVPALIIIWLLTRFFNKRKEE